MPERNGPPLWAFRVKIRKPDRRLGVLLNCNDMVNCRSDGVCAQHTRFLGAVRNYSDRQSFEEDVRDMCYFCPGLFANAVDRAKESAADEPEQPDLTEKLQECQLKLVDLLTLKKELEEKGGRTNVVSSQIVRLRQQMKKLRQG